MTCKIVAKEKEWRTHLRLTAARARPLRYDTWWGCAGGSIDIFLDGPARGRNALLGEGERSATESHARRRIGGHSL